jgi:hypothetical protein
MHRTWGPVVERASTGLTIGDRDTRTSFVGVMKEVNGPPFFYAK